MQNTKNMLPLAGVAVLLLAAGSVHAHHSFAMFDTHKTVTLEGTVREFQFTNPHSWVQLLVADPGTGKMVEWSLEGGATNGLARLGWKQTSLKPGDKAVLTIHPLKDGNPGGQLLTASVGGQQVGTPIYK